MFTLDLEDWNNLSFPDFNVIDIQFSAEQKQLKITVDGACLVDSADAYLENTRVLPKGLGKGDLFFHAWKEFIILQQNMGSNKLDIVSCIAPGTEFEVIKDICEFSHKEESICIKGFGKNSGLWTEYRINGAAFEFIFE